MLAQRCRTSSIPSPSQVGLSSKLCFYGNRNLATRMDSNITNYSKWSVEDLTNRVNNLERELREANAKLEVSYLTYVHGLT